MLDTLKQSANAVQVIARAGKWVVDNGVPIGAAVILLVLMNRGEK